MDTPQEHPRSLRPGAILAGGIVLALGLAMLLDLTGGTDLHAGRVFTPLLLIVLGASSVLDGGTCRTRGEDGSGHAGRGRRRRERGLGGFWLIGVGVWMLISQNHLFGLSYGTSWPLLMIMAGLMVVMRGMR